MLRNAAWKSVVVIVWLVSGGGAFGAGGKYNILGLTTNMPQAEAEQIIAKANWACEVESHDSVIIEKCQTGKTDYTEVKIHYATILDKHPISYILAFGTPSVHDVSEKIGRQPDCRDDGYIWELDDSTMLKLIGDDHLKSQALVQLNSALPTIRRSYAGTLKQCKARKTN